MDLDQYDSKSNESVVIRINPEFEIDSPSPIESPKMLCQKLCRQSFPVKSSTVETIRTKGMIRRMRIYITVLADF